MKVCKFVKHYSVVIHRQNRWIYIKSCSKSKNPIMYIRHKGSYMTYKQYLQKFKKNQRKGIHKGGIIARNYQPNDLNNVTHDGYICDKNNNNRRALCTLTLFIQVIEEDIDKTHNDYQIASIPRGKGYIDRFGYIYNIDKLYEYINKQIQRDKTLEGGSYIQTIIQGNDGKQYIKHILSNNKDVMYDIEAVKLAYNAAKNVSMHTVQSPPNSIPQYPTVQSPPNSIPQYPTVQSPPNSILQYPTVYTAHNGPVHSPRTVRNDITRQTEPQTRTYNMNTMTIEELKMLHSENQATLSRIQEGIDIINANLKHLKKEEQKKRDIENKKRIEEEQNALQKLQRFIDNFSINSKGVPSYILKDQARDQARDQAKDKERDQARDQAKDKERGQAKDKAKDKERGQAKDKAKDQAKDESKLLTPRHFKLPVPVTFMIDMNMFEAKVGMLNKFKNKNIQMNEIMLEKDKYMSDDFVMRKLKIMYQIKDLHTNYMNVITNFFDLFERKYLYNLTSEIMLHIINRLLFLPFVDNLDNMLTVKKSDEKEMYILFLLHYYYNWLIEYKHKEIEKKKESVVIKVVSELDVRIDDIDVQKILTDFAIILDQLLILYDSMGLTDFLGINKQRHEASQS